MEVRERKLRITLLYLGILCALIGAISTYVYAQISKELSGTTSGMFDLTRLFGGDGEEIEGIRAAVLRSEQTADYLAWVAENRIEDLQKNPGAADSDETLISPEETRRNYHAMSQFWFDQLEGNQIRADIIDESVLTSVDEMDKYNLLVLPATYCLSDEQIDAIKNFLVRRRNVLMTHFCGNRHEEGGSRPWSLLADVVGAELMNLSADRMEENATRLVFSRDNPVSADIPPGRRLPISTYDRPVAAKILDSTRSRPAAVWPNAAGMLPMEPSERAGVVYGEYRGGRFVWFGFTAQSVHSGSRYWPHFEQLVKNALHWSGRQPTVGRSTWPGTYSSAAAVGVKAKAGYLESSATSVLRDSKVPHVVFLPSEDSQVLPLGVLRGSGDVEAGLTYEGTFHENEMGPEEIGRANSVHSEFDKKWDIDVAGLVFEQTPENLFQPSDMLKYDYVWLADETMYAPRLVTFGRGTKRPFFSRVPAKLAAIGQSSRGDSQLAGGFIEIELEDMVEGLSRDLHRVRQIGGLYSVTLQAEYREHFWENETFQAWLDDLKSPDVWLATPSEIAGWWKDYSGVKLQVRQEGGRYTLRVSNEGNEEVPSIRVFIYPGILPEELEIRAERMRTQIPDYRIRSNFRRIELVLTDIEPRENRTYYIDF